jgi:alpha-tubulin suppressor-like RCC1 family protein
MTIAPMAYNPDVNDSVITTTSGIGITFDHRIIAGSGNVTLSIATNAGAAGTTVENFGVGSSVTIQGRKAIIDPTRNLNMGETYHISYPSGAFTNTSGDVSYVGTAYTFGVELIGHELWLWGYNVEGMLGQNNKTAYSSPVQIPGTTWTKNATLSDSERVLITKNDGTLWGWGRNQSGQLAQNNRTNYSSPIQIPGTTWDKVDNGTGTVLAIKTDGTLWAWGRNEFGLLGLSEGSNAYRSSPVQIPGTTWAGMGLNRETNYVVKTDGTLWVWGPNSDGQLGLNEQGSHPGLLTSRSSPVQLGSETTWSSDGRKWGSHTYNALAVKTDGTLWVWGKNQNGALGQNNETKYSSPVQIPGTTWKYVTGGGADWMTAATKTDGTLWAWGGNNFGVLGQNDRTNRSSPVQIPGTTWDKISGAASAFIATKTDGTLWSWGTGTQGNLGQNQGPSGSYSSPVQIPGTWSDPLAARLSYYGGGLKEV